MPASPSTRSLSPEYVLLGLLARQPAHGYELHQRLAADLGQIWRISLSQTYNILNRLEARGFIAGTIQEQPKHPAKRRFRLTAAGRRRFAAWLRATTGSSVHAIRVEFITRLYFAASTSRDLARELIDSQIVETRSGLARLQDRLAELPGEQTFNRLGLELRVRQLASIVDWLAQCRDVLDPGKSHP